MAWYREWFGEEYLELYAHRDATEAERHARFVAELLAAAPAGGGPILDLACGTGRHVAPLRHLELPVVGVDLSLVLLGQARGWPRAAGDMCCLPFGPATFSWVLNFFTSFGYFESERQNFLVLEEISRILEPGGRLFMDLMNPTATLARLQPRERIAVGELEAEIHRWFDPHTRRLNKRIRLLGDDRETMTFLESVRLYERDEVVIGLRWAGLDVVSIFGDFEGRPYGGDSERLILLAEKTDVGT